MQEAFRRRLSTRQKSVSNSHSADPLESLSDEQLINRFRDGDKRAFDTLIHRYERPIYNLAYRLTGNDNDAQEVVAEAFLRICMNLHTIQHAITLPAWTNRIVANAYINMRRHDQRRPSVSLDAMPERARDAVYRTGGPVPTSPQGQVEANERRAILQQAIAALPKSQRPLVSLFHYEGRTYKEIADTLHVPTGTVKSRLNRARLALREMLAPHQTALAG